MAQRRQFSAAFKAKVAIEAIKGEKTLNEIASMYEVHPNQVGLWKKEALELLPKAMADGRTKEARDSRPVDEEQLHRKIGQQAIEIDFLKKKIASIGIAQRIEMVGDNSNKLSVRQQCDLLDVPRQRLYYRHRPVSSVNLFVMDCIDREFTEHPVIVVEHMCEVIFLRLEFVVNHKRVRRLMRKMGLMAVYPKPRTSIPAAVYCKYPCLLGSLTIDRPDVVWCSDITYIRLDGGFMYLVAIMDYFSRYVLSWSVSNSLDSLFCLDALDEALSIGHPQIFHSDQGRQYTSTKFVDALNAANIGISMSGKGRAFDNILVERLWRTVKYEEIYLNEYSNGRELIAALERYFDYYNNRRPHQSLDYKTPSEVYFGRRASAASGSSAAAISDELFNGPFSSAAGPSHTRLSVFEAAVAKKREITDNAGKIVTAATLCKGSFGIDNG